MKTYGVLLIGCGHIGMQHLLDIYYRENIRIEAVVDQDPERVAQAAHRCGALAWGQDYRPFLKSDQVDIVIIATYTDSHLPILRDAWHTTSMCCAKSPLPAPLRRGGNLSRRCGKPRKKCWSRISCAITALTKR